VTLIETDPYLVLRWTRSGAVDDYMELLAAATPADNDLVVGKSLWTAGVLTSIVYTERTTPNVHNLFLKVVPTIPDSTSIRVKPGVVHTGTNKQVIVDQAISLAAYAAAQVVYVFVTDAGGVSHSTTASAYVGRVLLAKVTMPVGAISESDIEDIRTFLTAPGIPDEDTIERDANGKLKVMDPYYYTMQNDNVQASGVAVWTKLVFDNTKSDGSGQISEASGVITLTAGKMYKLSCNVMFDRTTGSGHLCGESRIRVLTGDTAWNFDNTTNNLSWMRTLIRISGIAGAWGRATLSGTFIILPSSDTTLQLEVLTVDATYGGTSLVTNCSLSVWTQ